MPAARNRATTTASSRGISPLWFRLPISHLYPAVAIDDFTVTGSPCRARVHHARRVHRMRLHPHALRIKISERIQLRIELFNLLNMRFGQFHHRDLACPQHLQLPNRGRSTSSLIAHTHGNLQQGLSS